MTPPAPGARRARKSAPRRSAAAPAVAPPRHPVAAARDHDAAPRYLQIARELTAAIASGRYPVGARLPTELELCEQFAHQPLHRARAVRVLS